MNKTKIEWTDYTWNPVVGCKNGCWYCYAKRMNDRFKWIPKWDEPKFFPERLNDKMPKKPSKIFVGSMCDLFGDWIPSEWIIKVIEVIENNPKHKFQFLTKNPKRYLEFNFPENCWLGITITKDNDYAGGSQKAIDILSQVPNYRFISFEPLLGDAGRLDLSHMYLIILGAMTGQGAILPKREWIKSIKHMNIFYKNNIKKFLTP